MHWLLQVVVWSGMEEAAAGPKVHSGSFLEGSTPWYGWVASAVFWWTVYLFLQLLFADTVNEWNEDRFLVAFIGTYLWFYDHAAGIFGVLMAIGGVIKTASTFRYRCAQLANVHLRSRRYVQRARGEEKEEEEGIIATKGFRMIRNARRMQ